MPANYEDIKWGYLILGSGPYEFTYSTDATTAGFPALFTALGEDFPGEVYTDVCPAPL